MALAGAYQNLVAPPTGGVPSTDSGNYVLEVDWDNDGVYATSSGENISNLTREVLYSRGRDFASQLTGRAIAGKLEATLLNVDGRFNSFATAGPLYGNILPGRPVRLRAVAPTTYTLWAGFLDVVEPLPVHGGLNTARLTALGPLGRIAGRNVSVAGATGVPTGTAVGTILDNAGWATSTNRRSIDSGQSVMNRWWVDFQEALPALRELEETEAGYLGESPDGKIVYEDRHHRLQAPHTVSQAVYTDAATGALRYDHISEADPLALVFNVFESRVRTFEAGTIDVLWTLAESGSESPAIAPGETRTFWAEYPNPESPSNGALVHAWTTPDPVTDYTAAQAPDGSGTDLTASLSITATHYARTMSIEITNGHATLTAYVTFLQARGVPVVEGATTRVVQESTNSQNKYGRRSYANAAPWIPNTAEAESWGAYGLNTYAEAAPVLTLGVLGNRSSDQLVEVQTRDISDRITVAATSSDSGLGINGDFFVEAVRGRIDHTAVHRVEYDLSPTSQAGQFWILDVSALDVDTILAY